MPRRWSRARSAGVIGSVAAGVAILGLALNAMQPAEPAGPTPAPTVQPASPPAPSVVITPTPTVTPTAEPIPTTPTVEPPPPSLDPFPCGAADPTCASAHVQSAVNVPLTDIVDCGGYGCQLTMDVFWPPEGSGLHTVVMIPGGPLPPGNRSSMWQLARYVAARGAVVFVADYRASPATGGGRPVTFRDVGCAVRTARARAPEHGGSASSVALLGYSFGGFPAAVLGTTPDAGVSPECLEHGGRSRPERLIGVAGVYLPGHLDAAFVEQFVGGSRDALPDGWRAVDAAELAGDVPPIPVLLVSGGSDLTGRTAYADELAAAVSAGGYPVSQATDAGATHDTILSSAVTVDAIEALLAAP